MASNIFQQDPIPAQVSPPVQTATPPAQASQPPAVQQTATPPAPKRSFRLPLNAIVAVLVLGVLVLGVFGQALPTDGMARDLGRAVVSWTNNSPTTMGYALVLLMVASAVIGSALGRRSK